MKSIDEAVLAFLDNPWNVVAAGVAALLLVLAVLYLGKLFFYIRFILKSLLRNALRTALTGMATFMLVLVITLVWMVLAVLNEVTTEKSKDLKAIVTERWQIPSQMPMAYASTLARGGVARDEDVKVQDSMTWQFYGGTLDPAKRTRENIVFFFGMDPAKLMTGVGLNKNDYRTFRTLEDERRRLRNSVSTASEQDKAEKSRLLSQWEGASPKGGALGRLQTLRTETEKELRNLTDPIVKKLLVLQQPPAADIDGLADFVNKRCSYESMMDGLDDMTSREQLELYLACLTMERDRRKVVIGQDRLKALQKKVGEKFTVSGLNYPGIDLEVEVLGTFPPGRYDGNAILNKEYIQEALDAFKKKTGTEHFMARRSLNLVWLRVADTETFRQVAEDITTSPLFKDPAVKCETASSGIASFLDAYRIILFGVRWIFVPAMLATLVLVIANSISISVRERRTEMAVLKVLGFGPGQIMVLVLGEALLIGFGFGLVSAAGTYALINWYFQGLKFPIGFFPSFMVPREAFLWGPAVGGGTALVGSLLPALSARWVKVSEVFSKIS
jgi:putative ABC transport system permease protein